MPHYDVSILRTLELSTTITVLAESEDNAESKALEQLQKSLINWTITDDNNWQEDGDDISVDSIEKV
jgi:hypothetical protein